MEQLSEAWFEARLGKITASAVGGILGLSPFVSREDVMRRMVRDALGAESEFQGNVATRHGQNNEAGAIIEFRFETGLEVEPASFVLLEDGDAWLGASPDGYTSDGGLIEVKAPYSLRDAEKPAPFKSLAEQPHYAAQIQVQLFVTDRPHCHFYQWCPKDTRHEIISRDDDWLSANIPILRQFHAEYLDELRDNPDEHLAPKRAVLDTTEAHSMVAEWDDLKTTIAVAQERQRDLLDNMVSLAGGKDALFAGRKLTCVEREGAVSYAAVVKKHLPELDLAPFKGKASKYWRLN